jgi:hypothetical protein
MTHEPGPDGWNDLNTMAGYLVAEARRQALLDVFVLNYDAILDSALLMNDAPDVRMTDEFQGFGGRDIRVFTPDGAVAEIPGLPWRAIPPWPPRNQLAHHRDPRLSVLGSSSSSGWREPPRGLVKRQLVRGLGSAGRKSALRSCPTGVSSWCNSVKAKVQCLRG